MTDTPTPSATNEELLRRVIEAQVRGGYEDWKEWVRNPLMFGSVGNLPGYTSVFDLNLPEIEKHHIL